jgi:hypothetical protein
MENDMGWNSINLGFRFLLELTAVIALGYWGWIVFDDIWRVALGIGLPLAAAVIWGTFRVPDEPMHRGDVPVPIPGVLRLLLELVLFASASWLLILAGTKSLGWIFAALVAIHYVISYDRVLWLLRK